MFTAWVIISFFKVKQKRPKTSKYKAFERLIYTGDERIELPPKVLETPIIPFDQSPTKYIFIYSQNYIHVDISLRINFLRC